MLPPFLRTRASFSKPHTCLCSAALLLCFTSTRHKHCQPSEISILNENGTEAEVAITEGFYHQVKRMIHSCGSRVLLLKRSQIGNLQLDPSLKEGQVREMSTKELVLLCKDFDLETRELLANSYN
eukprot:m.118652 g.118652  ORF g.118652 m.118652 type:complete len:125 (+) comp9345_c0_seq8:104-478(+)